MIRWEHTVSVLMNSVLLSVCTTDHWRAFKCKASWGQKGEEGWRGSKKEIHISRRPTESQRARAKGAEWQLALKGWWQNLSPPSFSISRSPLSSLRLMNCRMRVCDMNVYVRAAQRHARVSSHESVSECVNGMCERWRERGREGGREERHENRHME